MCHFGTKADLYYIILEGEVVIKTKTEHVLEGERLSPFALLIFFIEYYKDVFWKELKNGD